MDNKNVGYMLLGVSVVIIAIIFLFQNALTEIVATPCGDAHSLVCPMNQTINQQTYLALGIVAILMVISVMLIRSRPEEKIIVQEKRIVEKPKKRTYDLSDLKPEEKKVFALVKENKAIFQSDLIEKTEFGKAKMTRIIDRLEGQGLVERKRRGMTNVVVLRE